MKKFMVGVLMGLMLLVSGCGEDKAVMDFIRRDMVHVNRYTDSKNLIGSLHDEILYASYGVYLINQYGVTAVTDTDEMYARFMMEQNNGFIIPKSEFFNNIIFKSISTYGTLNYIQAYGLLCATAYEESDPTKDKKTVYTIFENMVDPYDPNIWNVKKYKPTKEEKEQSWYEGDIYEVTYKNEYIEYKLLVKNNKERGDVTYAFDRSKVILTLDNGQHAEFKVTDNEYSELVATGYASQIVNDWYKAASDYQGNPASLVDLYEYVTDFYNESNEEFISPNDLIYR